MTAALLAVTACGGNKSASNTAGNAANSMASAAGNAGNAMASAAGNAGNAMGSMANGAMEKMGAMPNCGAVKPMWVNLRTKVYHEPGDRHYGKTKHGEYLCPSQAKAQGFHPAGGAMRRRMSSSSDNSQ
ncbi:MAG: hypothetical protein JOY69_09270 [Candidatus Eremiobacteraeota bacterium]|nr:hypothetical protein [Candidatus Eremiobacteraeota bacterium]